MTGPRMCSAASALPWTMTARSRCWTTCPTTGWSTTSMPRWWTRKPTILLGGLFPLTRRTRPMLRLSPPCLGPAFSGPCTTLVRGPGLAARAGCFPTTTKTGSWLSSAFRRMRSCPFGRMLTTPSWMPPSMSMWCWSTMKPSRPGMWSRWRSCTAAAWTALSAGMTGPLSRTILPGPGPTSPQRTPRQARKPAIIGSASPWCALRAPTMKSPSCPG